MSTCERGWAQEHLPWRTVVRRHWAHAVTTHGSVLGPQEALVRAGCWDHVPSLSFSKSQLRGCNQLQEHLEYFPICFKPTPKEPALRMVSPPLTRGCIPFVLTSALKSSRHLYQLPVPRGFSRASSPLARALGWAAKVGKVSQSYGFPLELELWFRDPWPPTWSGEESTPGWQWDSSSRLRQERAAGRGM